MPASSLLWVGDLNQKTKIYLFGTVHLNKPEYAGVTSSLFPLIADCSYYFSEINLDEQHLAQEKFSISETDISSSKGKVFTKFAYRFKKHFNHDISHLSDQPDFFIVQYISQYLLSHESGLFMDQVLWEYAKSQSCICDGLENINDQVQLLTKLVKNAQGSDMKKISTNLSSFRKSLLKVHNAYLHQDIKSLYNLSSKTLGKNRKHLIKERNYKMLHSIVDQEFNSSVFVAVGAAHLAGKFGLIALLKRSGIKLNPIYIKFA